MDKDEKIEVVKEIIDIKVRTMKLEQNYKHLNTRVDRLEEDYSNNRKKSNEIKRTAWEALNIATGNRDKVELNSHRITDTKEKFDRIDDGIKWVVRAIIGLIVTVVGTVVLDYFIDLL